MLPPIQLKVDTEPLLSASVVQPQFTAPGPQTAPAPPAALEVARSGPKLPETTILEKHRFTGVPRDELPAAIAAAGK